jgi:hypothetical protein
MKYNNTIDFQVSDKIGIIDNRSPWGGSRIYEEASFCYKYA